MLEVITEPPKAKQKKRPDFILGLLMVFCSQKLTARDSSRLFLHQKKRSDAAPRLEWP